MTDPIRLNLSVNYYRINGDTIVVDARELVSELVRFNVILKEHDATDAELSLYEGLISMLTQGVEIQKHAPVTHPTKKQRRRLWGM